MSCFCYLHIFPNSKIYVGSTQKEKVEYRWKNGYGYRQQPFIWNAICKYGWENVRHKVIVCETPEEMWEKEKELIKEYDTTNPEHGYNLSIGGESGPMGCKRTEETRKKLSESHKGHEGWNKGKSLTEEHRKKLSESHKGEKNNLYGTHRSEETKIKISKSRKGKGTGPQPKFKWLTPQGEIKEMSARMVSRYHKDWIKIYYLDEAVRMKSNILISRGVTRFQGIMDNIYYFTYDGLFTELRQTLTQQFPNYIFSIQRACGNDYIQGICLQYE